MRNKHEILITLESWAKFKNIIIKHNIAKYAIFDIKKKIMETLQFTRYTENISRNTKCGITYRTDIYFISDPCRLP